jgi:hypothetical protein
MLPAALFMSGSRARAFRLTPGEKIRSACHEWQGASSKPPLTLKVPHGRVHGEVYIARYLRKRRVRALRPAQLSSDVGPGVRRLLGSERIEVDEKRIVGVGLATRFFAAVNMNKGLHAPRVQIVHMLMPQRDRQQIFR